jgi:hypothetical protein
MTEPALRCIGHQAKGNLKHERMPRHLRIAGRFHFLGLKSIRYEKIRTTSHTANRNSKTQSLNFHARATQSVITGCWFCRKHFGTLEQFKRHLNEDVIPPLLDKLSAEPM